jgi:hypothetical protein
LSLAVVARYATVRAEVERRGHRKSDFDRVIACTALEHGATLVTNDGALEDGNIDGLVVEDWLANTSQGGGALGPSRGGSLPPHCPRIEVFSRPPVAQNGQGGRIRTDDPQPPSLFGRSGSP